MKANELRIGNYVNNAGGKPIICTAQTISDFESGLIILTPITLTENILLDNGAVKALDFFTYDRFVLKYREDYNFWYVMAKHTFDYITKINFLHEWQNVLFALNSNESKRKQ